MSLTASTDSEETGGKPTPVISIIMPVYNAERYLGESLDSVLSQTFSDFEFLIFDDGSTDRTGQMIQKAAQRDSRIRYFPETHEGYSAWLKKGVEIARGEYIARMDSDDVCLPDRFQKQIEYLRTHPEVDVVGTKVLVIDPEGWPICENDPKYHHEEIEESIIRGQLAGGINHPSSMIRRQAILEVGGYRPSKEPAEDVDLWLRIAEHGRLANLPEVLLKYRMHAKSISAQKYVTAANSKRAALEEMATRRGWDLEQRLPEFQPRSRPLFEVELFRQWSKMALGAGNMRTARKYAIKAIFKQPFAVDLNRQTYQLILGERLTDLMFRLWRCFPNRRDTSC